MQSSPIGKGLPDPALAQDPTGKVARESLASEVYDGHKRGRNARRQTDLTREMYLVHINGEGDGQWADIIDGSRVQVPAALSGGLRFQYNLERPMTENMVAYHTAQQFQCLAQATASNEARDSARIDTIFANDILHTQRANQVIASAMMMGAAYGSCPVHVQWRHDTSLDTYEPVWNPGEGMQLRPGYIDLWAGDPWDTIYNDGAKRNSIHWLSYGRVYPLKMVKQAFQHVPEIERLEGRDDLVSASRFQRIVRYWGNLGQFQHGTAAMTEGFQGDELIALICREVAAGVLPDFPQGRLTVVALNGAADTDPDRLQGSASEAFLLHDGPLPGKVFSVVPFYCGFAADDVLGKAYIADIDELQILLNQLVTHEVEFIRRYARPPFKTIAGGMIDDTVTTEDDAVMEFTDVQGLQAAQFMYPPALGRGVYDSPIERTMDQMFRIGGWQAASRGESKAGDPAAKVVALAEADDTVFAPVNQAMRLSLVKVLQACHSLAKENMTIPWLLQNVAGSDLGYLAEPYIHRNQLSDKPPDYVIVSGFGATPRNKVEQLMGYVQMTGADGRPLMSTEEFWRQNPDTTSRPPEIGASHIKQARALKINETIKAIVKGLREQFGEGAGQFIPQAQQMIDQEFRLRRDDPIELHIETLSQLTQDEQVDPFVRELATARQEQYFNWQELQARPIQEPEGEPARASTPKPKQPQDRMGELRSEVASLTAKAGQA